LSKIAASNELNLCHRNLARIVPRIVQRENLTYSSKERNWALGAGGWDVWSTLSYRGVYLAGTSESSLYFASPTVRRRALKTPGIARKFAHADAQDGNCPPGSVCST